jgi:hypothetical protein
MGPLLDNGRGRAYPVVVNPPRATAALAALLLPGAAAAIRVTTGGLEPMKRWTVYDDGPAGTLDLERLCRAAYLPCGAVLRPGDELSVPSGPIGGENAYDLLTRLLAAHPGYRAEFSQGALNVLPKDDACLAALDKPAPRANYAKRTALSIAADELEAAGLRGPAAGLRAAALARGEVERYLDLDFEVRKGATLRDALNGAAAADGRMMWVARSTGRGCGTFRGTDWRKSQALARPAKRGWVPNGNAARALMPERAEVAPPPPVMLESGK